MMYLEQYEYPMKHLRLLLLSSFVILLVGGCSTTTPKLEKANSIEEQQYLRAQASSALEAAHTAMKEAVALGWQSHGAESLLTQAENGFAKGQYALAFEQAQQVESLALNGSNALYLRMADSALNGLKSLTRLSYAQLENLEAISKSIRTGNGRVAYENARRMLSELEAAQIQYLVENGDSLWKISAKDDIYANPFHWPLIYKANRDQIKDPDLIYPGQKLNVDQHPSSSAVDAAVDHAKHRGAWSVGDVEASDKAYLEK